MLGGIIRDGKRKNSFIGAVVVLNPKARKTSAVEATFVIVNVDNASEVGCGSTIYTIPTSPHPTGTCTFQPGFAFCSDVGARNLTMGYLGLPLPGESPNELGNDALGLGCGRFGADSPESHDLLDFLSPPLGAPPPSGLTCTSPLSFFDPTEIVGKLSCNQAIGGFDFAAPPGFTLTNFLPGSCQLTSTTLQCRASVPANSPFEFNLQTMPVPSAGMGGQIAVYQNGSVALRFNATGPWRGVAVRSRTIGVAGSLAAAAAIGRAFSVAKAPARTAAAPTPEFVDAASRRRRS